MQPIKQILLDAVAATTTSGGVPVNNAGRLSIQIKAASITSGNGVFTVDVSNNGSDWTVYNRITSNVTNTNAQMDTRVASVTLSANGTAFLFFPPGDTFAFVRVTVTRTTDGSYSATAYTN